MSRRSTPPRRQTAAARMSSWSSAPTRAATRRGHPVTLVARITFLVLVGATFAAFFVAQRLKSSPPFIRVAKLDRAFSPARRPNRFSVTLKAADDVTVDIVNLDGDRVKRLADAVPVAAHRPFRLEWSGTTDAGARAPD